MTKVVALVLGALLGIGSLVAPTHAQSGRPFPPESGRIHRDGGYLREVNGRVWDWRGATMFMLFARFWRGEDITPQIQWMQRTGVNVARILIAGHPGLREFDAFAQAWKDDPNFWTTFDRFMTRMADAGLRVEITVVSDESKDVATWRAVLQQTYDHAAPHWNAMVEWVNEPFSRADRLPTLRALMQMPIERRGVLSAYGLEPEAGGAEGQFKAAPVLDYVTVRTGRERESFPRNSKHLMERRDVLHAPIVDDEPLGIGEAEEAGRRTANEVAVANHFAVARLFGAGATIHTQAGLEGRAPDPRTEPVQTSLSQAIARIWRFLPGDLQTGEYLAPHLGGWPVRWESGRDSAVNHAYGKRVGDHAWIVNVLSRDGWVVTARAGWRVVETGPYPWIAHIARD